MTAMSETHTKTRDETLVDAVRESPVDSYLLRSRRIRLLLLLAIVVVIVAVNLLR